MTDKVDPETMETLRRLVGEMAEKDYPRVWIGQEGIAADELLAIQQANEGLPEEPRAEPGEFVDLEEFGAGVLVPDVGTHWLDGKWVLENMPDLVPEDLVPGLGDLRREVAYIEAAKRGGVVIETAAMVAFVPPEALTPDDRLFILSASFGPEGEAVAVVFGGYRTRFVALSDLAPEDVDEELLDTLEFHASDGMWPYVVEDSQRARRALRERLGEEG